MKRYIFDTAGAMAEFADREHFLPIRVPELVDLLCADAGPGDDAPLSAADQAGFRRFADSAAAHVHAHYLTLIRGLEDDYAAFDPDSDLLTLRPLPDADRPAKLATLFDQFAALLEKANFQRLTRPELEQVMAGASDWGVDMHVPFDAYERLDVFVRGKGETVRTRRKWYRFFRKEKVAVPTFSRVAMILKQQPHRELGPSPDVRNVFLKLFKDIPQKDIEMLLPGTRIKMPLLDRLKLGGTGVGSLGYVAWKIQSMIPPLLKAFGLLAAGAVAGEVADEPDGRAKLLGLLALYTPLALVGGYAFRTYSSFTTTKKTYQLQLSQSLYYQGLDSNAGVMHRLLDAAEDQETREVLLAYFYLWRYAGTDGWEVGHLDDYVEAELERRAGCKVDFEIDDAVNKLLAGRVAEKLPDGKVRAVPLRTALDRLDDVWERYANRTATMPHTDADPQPSGAV